MKELLLFATTLLCSTNILVAGKKTELKLSPTPLHQKMIQAPSALPPHKLKKIIKNKKRFDHSKIQQKTHLPPKNLFPVKKKLTCWQKKALEKKIVWQNRYNTWVSSENTKKSFWLSFFLINIAFAKTLKNFLIQKNRSKNSPPPTKNEHSNTITNATDKPSVQPVILKRGPVTFNIINNTYIEYVIDPINNNSLINPINGTIRLEINPKKVFCYIYNETNNTVENIPCNKKEERNKIKWLEKKSALEAIMMTLEKSLLKNREETVFDHNHLFDDIESYTENSNVEYFKYKHFFAEAAISVKKNAITISQKTLDLATPEELRSVIAHELGHSLSYRKNRLLLFSNQKYLYMNIDLQDFFTLAIVHLLFAYLVGRAAKYLFCNHPYIFYSLTLYLTKKIFVLLETSKNTESENILNLAKAEEVFADIISILSTLNADPLITFFEKIEKLHAGRIFSHFSSDLSDCNFEFDLFKHPPLICRIKYLKQLMQQIPPIKEVLAKLTNGSET